MERSRLAKIRTGRTHYRAAIAVFLVTLASAVVCNAAKPIITQGDLLEKLESGTAPLILDVRTPGEYRSGHVPEAINIPHNELAGRLAELLDAKDREVVTYCERGPRAGFAESVLQEAGFSAVRHLVGDMYAWRRNGLPIERP
ncbi:MAG: rhodanese-like domain-containing protein [Acidiferrobacterales bacterium]